MTPTLEAEAPAAEIPAHIQPSGAIFYRGEIEDLMRFQRLCESHSVECAWRKTFGEDRRGLCL